MVCVSLDKDQIHMPATSRREKPYRDGGSLLEGWSDLMQNFLRIEDHKPSPDRRNVHTICVHGDSPNAVVVAKAVREGLETAGYDVRSFVA